MMARWGISVALGALLLGGADSAWAQTHLTEHVLQADSAAVSPNARLADATWLAGHWCGTGLGAAVEEVWLPAAGGAMSGIFRSVRDGEVEFYELVTLVEEGGSLILRLKHFEAGLVGWEEADEVVTFPLVRVDPDALLFDGLTMRRASADRLHVWVALRSQGEEVREELFSYRRMPACGDAEGPSDT